MEESVSSLSNTCLRIHSANRLNSEAWRYAGPFTRWNRLKGAFPGFGWGAGAFAVYLVYEQLFMKDSHGHGEEHGSEHH